VNPFATLASLIDRDGAAALVTVVRARGSTPREAGARMVVSVDGAIAGTIGGGRLESEALAAASRLLAAGTDGAEVVPFALGPALGQCCGGHVTILVEPFARPRLEAVRTLAASVEAGPVALSADLVPGKPVERHVDGAADGPPTADLGNGRLTEVVGRRLRPLMLFGAGHVGRAVVLALAPLPFAVTWVDERAEMFPSHAPRSVRCVATARPQAVAAGIAEGGFALVMTHDHAVDLEILHALLASGRAAYAGLIGSATKRARFERRLTEAGLDRAVATSFRCPIGVAGITSKEPALIAASVAADLLVADEAARGAMGRESRPLIAAVRPR
jgi:xanthine dehydrogenase accessory factor